MQFSVQDIQKILGLDPSAGPRRSIDRVMIDTRMIVRGEDTLFVALPGGQRHGHDFVQQAYDLGVRYFLVTLEQSLPSDAVQLIIPDSLLALQQLAQHYRAQWQGRVIGITGSNGKTIIKEWLFHLLHTARVVGKSPESYNSQIGVALSILQQAPDQDITILEAGISQRGEMKQLADMIRPDIGLFTMIGDAHSAGFKDQREKIEEKCKLFQHAELLLYPADSVAIREVVTARWSDEVLVPVSTQDIGSHYCLLRTAHGLQFYKKGELVWEASLAVGQNQMFLQNLAHCLAIADVLSIPLHTVTDKLNALPPLAMRMQMHPGNRNSLVINDSYSADIASMQVALDFMQQQSSGRRKTVFLAPFDDQREQGFWHEALAQLLQRQSIDRLIILHESLLPLVDRMQQIEQVLWYPSVEDFMQNGDVSFYGSQDIVLLKGSRTYRLERLQRLLTKHSHRSTLELNVSALQHNLRTLRRKLRPETLTMAMVKASAYGSGMIDIAQRLAFLGVDYFGVAFLDEGVQLREAGIRIPIMVMNAEDFDIDTARRYDLELSMHTPQDLDLIKRFAPDIPVHIHIDTGMHRMGWRAEDIYDAQWEEYDRLQIRSIYSHLAVAENADHDRFTHQQAQQFHKLSQHILKYRNGQPIRHILNSAGVIRFPEYQYDMVRLGIGLYGVTAENVKGEVLRPVHTFRSYIQEVRKVKAGESVSYGRTWVAETDQRIGIVPVGYADGLPRQAGHGRYALRCGGHQLPIIGTVCMDFCMVDLAAASDVMTGDDVIVYGTDHPIAELAAACGTISYEILSRISPRIPRVIVQ